jgi:DNA-binding FadR family transcriptional regulator
MSSISGVPSATNPYPITNQNSFAQSFKDLKAIGSALQSGDLTTAQSALATFQQDLQTTSQTSASQPFGQNSQANKDYQSLASALQSGDLAAAKKAFASLQTDLKAANKGHHHHHHGSSTTSPTSQTNSATPSSTVDSDGDNNGSKVNATA